MVDKEHSFIGIEGIYGAGKTSLLNNLSLLNKYGIIPEWSNLPLHKYREKVASLPPSNYLAAREGVDFFFDLERHRYEQWRRDNLSTGSVLVDKTPLAILALGYALENLEYNHAFSYSVRKYKKALMEGATFSNDAIIFLRCKSEIHFYERNIGRSGQRAFIRNWRIAKVMQEGYIYLLTKLPPDRLLILDGDLPVEALVKASDRFILETQKKDRKDILETALNKL